MHTCQHPTPATGLWQTLWQALRATRQQREDVQALREEWHQPQADRPEHSYHWRQPPL